RVAGFVAAMASCTETMLARWRTTAQPFDIASEMMALTLNIIAHTMFSRDVSGDVEAVRRLTDIVVRLPPSLLDLFGFPQWLPRRRPSAYRRALAQIQALVARFLAQRADCVGRRDPASSLLAPRAP